MIYTMEQIRDRVAPIARKYQIPSVYLFGSYARDDATEDSDIDLLIDTPRVPLRGFAWGGLYLDFDNAFEKSVDLVTLRSLEQEPRRPSDVRFRQNVLQERKLLYALA